MGRRLDQDHKTRRTDFGYLGQRAHPVSRIVRMVVTATFPEEPLPGHIAYKALSAGFITDPSHSDAFMLLAENVGPAALHMLSAMQRHHTHRPLIKPATASCSKYLRSSAQIESSSRSSTVNVLHTSNAETSQQLAV